MTLAAAASKVIYEGDGSTTSFGFSFEIETTDGSDLKISIFDNNGNESDLVSNYSVDVANSKVNYPTVGGVAPLGVGINALPANWYIVINRVEPLAQNLSLTNQGVFDAPSIEDQLDQIVMMIQQQQEQINRCVKYPINQTPATADVNAFITAVNAIIMPPVVPNTYASYKAQALAAPSKIFFGFATTLGSAGQFLVYCGNANVGDQGFIILGGG